ncbi:MAG: hypothetical protein KC425_13395 [Anaerolineales bacterium]|nr:hypothetical protein [Anaerolineales bacterium]
MPTVTAQSGELIFGDKYPFSLNFQRTLRIPDDDKTYPLPPGLGRFPILAVADYADRVPAAWRERGGFFIPMYQREALWISFSGRSWRPNAVKIGIGRINAVSGRPWDTDLLPADEDYVVCPPQPWLDGINAGDGFIRQFVAMPLGMGYTVEAQLTGKEEFGGIQIVVFEPRPGRFPDEPPPQAKALYRGDALFAMAPPPSPMPASAEMGLGAGGRMKQKIYPDPHGYDTWDVDTAVTVDVHIVNSLLYREITGQAPPPSPVSAQTYTQYGFPWFDLYDEHMADVRPPTTLVSVQSVQQLDEAHGVPPQPDDASVDVGAQQVITYDVDETTGVEKPDADPEADAGWWAGVKRFFGGQPD